MDGSSSRSPVAQEPHHKDDEGTALLGPDEFDQYSNSVGDTSPLMSELEEGIEIRDRDPPQPMKSIGTWRPSTSPHAGDIRSTFCNGPANPPNATVASNIQHFWETNRSCMLVVTSSFFSSAMALCTKLLELGGDGMDAFQILFIRMAVTTIWCTSLLCWERKRDSLLGPKEVRGLLLLRGISGFFGIVGIWSAIKLLSLADASVVTFLTPSIVGFYSAIVLRQPYNRKEQLASVVALVGVVFIARPSFLFGDPPPASHSSPSHDVLSPAPGVADRGHAAADYSVEEKENATQRLTGILFALLSAFGGAGTFIAIRAIGDRCNVLTTTNSFAVSCTLISAAVLAISPLVGYDQPHVRFGLPHDSRQWFLVAMITFCGFFAQWFLTAGLGSEKRSHKAPAMVYTGMLWTAGFDRFFLGQSMHWSSLLGCALIVGSAVWVVAMPKPGDKHNEAIDVEQCAGMVDPGTVMAGAESAQQESVQMQILRAH